MNWSAIAETRRLRPHWPEIFHRTGALSPVRIILVLQAPAGAPRSVEVHLPIAGPLPPPQPFPFAGFGSLTLRYVRGAEMRSQDQSPIHQTTVGRCAAGSSLRQQSAGGALGNFGTAGWNFKMGNDAYVLGSRHVLRSLSDDAHIAVLTPTGGTPVAELKWYEQLTANQDNIWDLAVAQFNDPASALARFVHDPTAAYPRRIASDLHSDEQCYKVGTTSLRTDGRLYGVGYELKCDVLADGTRYRFREQLYFRMGARGGDSGSVIVRSSDHALVGLLMGVIPTASLAVANPLFNYGLAVTNAGLGAELPEVDLVQGGLARNMIEV